MFGRYFVAPLFTLLFVCAGTYARGADAPSVNVDVLLSMSGSGTFVGNIERDSLNVLESMVNKDGGIRGRPLHFVYHDDQTDPQVAIQLLNAIVANHRPLVLGSSTTAPCHGIEPIVEANGPVDYCFTPAIYPARGSFMFSSSVASLDEVSAMVRYFRERGWKRIALVTATDVGGQEADSNVDAVLARPENKGQVTLVDREHFNATDLTVMAQLAKIKAAEPQAVILWASGTPFTTLLRDAASIGLDLPIAATNADMTYVQMKQYATFLPKELLFPGVPYLAGIAPTKPARDVQRRFFDAMGAAGIRPDFIYSVAWDPGLIAVEALRTIGPSATADQVRAFIENLHGFNGIIGEYDFRDGSQRGLTEDNVMMMRWDAAENTWTAVSRLGGQPL
jgi:branched-chain amino acid transport system substrate-binding protein